MIPDAIDFAQVNENIFSIGAGWLLAMSYCSVPQKKK
jgi:hypothetical protein